MRIQASLIGCVIILVVILLLIAMNSGVRTKGVVRCKAVICTPSRATVPGPLPPPEPQDSIEYPAIPERPRWHIRRDIREGVAGPAHGTGRPSVSNP